MSHALHGRLEMVMRWGKRVASSTRVVGLEVVQLWIDHVIWAVDDLDVEGERFERELGLRSFFGGVHPEGTANRIVPLLPPQYVELLTLNNEGHNEADPFDRLVAARVRAGGGLVSWGVGTDDIESFCARSGASIISGSIQLADGSMGTWRIAEPPALIGAMPFVIQYDGDPQTRSVRQRKDFDAAKHPCGATEISWVGLSGAQQQVDDWLGMDHELPVRIHAGPPGVWRVGLRTSNGDEIVLG